MDGRQEAFKALKDFGHKLVQEQHYARDEVETSLAQLEELRRTLGASWEERRHRLTQAHQRQLFDRQAQQAHAWLAAKESFLNNDDLGVRRMFLITSVVVCDVLVLVWYCVMC